MLGGAIEGTVQILAELRDAGISCYALSNWSAAKFVLTRPRFPFLEWFEGIVISGDVERQPIARPGDLPRPRGAVRSDTLDDRVR